MSLVSPVEPTAHLTRGGEVDVCLVPVTKSANPADEGICAYSLVPNAPGLVLFVIIVEALRFFMSFISFFTLSKF